MNRRTLVADAVRRLAEVGVASPEADAETLLAHVLGTDRNRLVLVDEVSDGDASTYDALVARRARREPLQHLTGRAYFRHVELAVGPGVFVPRPETELLAGWAIEQAAALEHPVVVDLGTGSGAIAKAVAAEVPAARVHAVEKDEPAHGWAIDQPGRHGRRPAPGRPRHGLRRPRRHRRRRRQQPPVHPARRLGVGRRRGP